MREVPAVNARSGGPTPSGKGCARQKPQGPCGPAPMAGDGASGAGACDRQVQQPRDDWTGFVGDEEGPGGDAAGVSGCGEGRA